MEPNFSCFSEGKLNIFYVHTVDSTQVHCRRLQILGQKEHLVIADIQTQAPVLGRKRWWSAPGGMFMSLAIESYRRQEHVIELAGRTAVAIINKIMLGKDFTRKAGFRSPNDIIFYDAKCGIVTAQSFNDCHFVVSCYLNMTPWDKLVPQWEFPKYVQDTEFSFVRTNTSPLELAKAIAKDWQALL